MGRGGEGRWGGGGEGREERGRGGEERWGRRGCGRERERERERERGGREVREGGEEKDKKSRKPLGNLKIYRRSNSREHCTAGNFR